MERRGIAGVFQPRECWLIYISRQDIPIRKRGIRQMQFDEMWHFIGSKKENFGSSKPLLVAHGKLWDGCSAVMILKLFEDSPEKSAI
jgi:hypothetical protein